MTGNMPLETTTADIGLRVKIPRMPLTTIFAIRPVFGLESRLIERQQKSHTSLPYDHSRIVFPKFGKLLLEGITLRFYYYVISVVGFFLRKFLPSRASLLLLYFFRKRNLKIKWRQ